MWCSEFDATWEANLSAKAAEEDATKGEMKNVAMAALEAMKVERDELRERNSSRNRDHEQVAQVTLFPFLS
jgi:hypothetical protein